LGGEPEEGGAGGEGAEEVVEGGGGGQGDGGDQHVHQVDGQAGRLDGIQRMSNLRETRVMWATMFSPRRGRWAEVGRKCFLSSS